MTSSLHLMIRTDTEGRIRRYSATGVTDARHLLAVELSRLSAEGYEVQLSVHPDQCLQHATVVLTHPWRPGHAVLLGTREASEHDYRALVSDAVQVLSEHPAATVVRGEVAHLYPALGGCGAQHIDFIMRSRCWSSALALSVAAALLEDWHRTPTVDGPLPGAA